MSSKTTLIYLDKLDPKQQKQWELVVKEASLDPFIGGDWLKCILDEPGEKPICFFKDGNLLGFMIPRQEMTKSRKLYWRSGAVYLMKIHRGKGIIGQILYDFFYDHHPAISWIDDRNAASIKLFTGLGFVAKGKYEDVGGDGHWYILDGKPKQRHLVPAFLNWS
jgi:predicted acetyltransferase